MKEQLSSSPEVSVNPHSDLPASGISVEITSAAEAVAELRSQPAAALPFGVYVGVPEPVDTPASVPAGST